MINMSTNFKCLVCDRTIGSNELALHKQQEPNGYKYAILWPEYNPLDNYCYDIDVPIYHSAVISKALDVRKVYILDEGKNISGSMKDYLVTKTIKLAEKKKKNSFLTLLLQATMHFLLHAKHRCMDIIHSSLFQSQVIK